MDSNDLRNRENTEDAESGEQSHDSPSPGQQAEIDQLDAQHRDSPDDNTAGEQPEGRFYKPSKKKGASSAKHKKRRQKQIAAGLGGGAIIVVILVIIMFMLASSKAIHFSTILRSTGFAGSQLIMRQAFNQAAYSKWALQNETAELPKSTLLEKLRGQDMRKVQRTLTDSGDFKYTVDSSGKTTGYEVRGKKVIFDELAQKAGKPSYDRLNFREKLSVHKYVEADVKFSTAEVFNVETRGFRNAFWKGFRSTTGIKMTRFRTIARDALGKRSVNDALNNDETRLVDELKDVGGEERVSTSENSEVKKAGDEVNESIEKAAEEGQRLKRKPALDRYLTTKGVDPIAFQEGISKVSDFALISTLYCIGHDLSKTSDRINEQTELSLARFGHQQQTTVDQIYNGDVTSEDVAFANKEWSGDDETGDAAQSPLYLEDTGRGGGSDANLNEAPRMNISLPFIDWLKPVDEAIRTALSLGLNQLPVIGNSIDSAIDEQATRACGVVMNPYAQTGLLVVEVGVTIASAGSIKAALLPAMKAIPVFVGFAGVGHLIEWYIGQATSPGVVGNETGEDRYTSSAISTDYLESQTLRGVTAGRPQSNDESASFKRLAMSELREHHNNAGFSERYFALTNPNSLLGLAVARTPSSLQATSAKLANLPSIFGSVISNTLKTISSVLGGSRVLAATEENVSRENDYFGVKQWGWTTQELAVLEDTNLVDNAATVEQDMQNDKTYYENLEKCYSPNTLMYELLDEDDCSAGALSSSRALRWRIYKLQSFAVNQISSEGINEN